MSVEPFVRKRLYVTASSYDGKIDNPERDVWTLSFDPDECGWTTDCGYPGYGLMKEIAEAIAAEWNKQFDEKKP